MESWGWIKKSALGYCERISDFDVNVYLIREFF